MEILIIMNLNLQPHARKHTAAFTLAEVVFAVGLFAFLFSSLYLSIGQGINVIQNARENLRATQIIQEVTEVCRLYSWDQVNSTFVPKRFTNYFDPSVGTSNRGAVYYGTVSISNAPISQTYTDTLCQMTVTVNWTNKNVPHTKQVVTFISEYGLQKYLY